LGGDADGLIHPDRDNAGGFLAQDVSDLHRNLLRWDFSATEIGIHYAKSQLNWLSKVGEKALVILTFLPWPFLRGH
jgi:hypothetical protein